MKKQFIGIVLAGCIVAVGVHMEVHAQSARIVPVAATATSTAMTKKARLQEAVTGLERSVEVRIANLEAIAIRIQSRIGKMQAEGIDVSAATVKLTEAQKQIAEAGTEMIALKKADTAMVAAAKPATAFKTIKAKSIKNVVAKIKAAHSALVETVTILKKGQQAGQASTSTTSVAQ